VERFEKLVYLLRDEPDPHVLYGQTQLFVLIPFGLDQQFSRPVFDIDHCVRGVPEQVQDYLLKLDTVRQNSRELVVKFRPQNDTVSLKLTQCEGNHLPRSLGQVDRFNDEVFSFEKVAQTRNDFRSTITVANSAPRGFASAFDIRRLGS
jgi:hypothetical protein